MKRILMVAVIMAAMILVTCEGAQKAAIVGNWIEEESGLEFKINADGTIFGLEDGEVENEGTWKMSEKEPWILSIYEDGDLEVEISVKFISNNEVEFSAEGEKIRMKRK